MDESKPKETPQRRSRTFAEFMALKVEPTPCAWEGCKEKATKHCCGFSWDGGCCQKPAYCAHHFYRHLAIEHPKESERRGGTEIKKLL